MQEIRPPTPVEAAIIDVALDALKRAIDQLEREGSPWAAHLDSFGEILHSAVHPED